MELYFNPDRGEYVIEDKGYILNLKEEELKAVLKNPTGISFKVRMDRE